MTKRYMSTTAILSLLVALILCLAYLMTPRMASAALSSLSSIKEAKSYYLMADDGTVLIAHDEFKEMPPASITKVMTAIVALDSNMPLDKTYTVHKVELEDDAQTASLTGEETITLRQLLQVMLIYSANDAAQLIAEICSNGHPEKFYDEMNKTAKEIGMNNTHFVNPHGLDMPNHYSCAHDLALMGHYALDNYPFIAETVHTPKITIPVGNKELTFYTTDHLMGSYPGILGIKTGFVDGNATFLGAAERHGVKLFSVVLGCQTIDGRFDDSRELLNYGFENYKLEDTLIPTVFAVGNIPNYSYKFLYNPQVSILSCYSKTAIGRVDPKGPQVSKTNDTENKYLDSYVLGADINNTVWTQGKRRLCSATTYIDGITLQTKPFNINEQLIMLMKRAHQIG